ncbi:MAG TPA: hypothetical protein VGE58_07210 [Daejeonella sp.]
MFKRKLIMGIFEINDSIDKFKLLVKQYEHYKNKQLSTDTAVSFFETAWSLTEWVGKEFGGVVTQNDLGIFRNALYPRCPHLKVLHDISNMSKHMTLSKPKSSISKTGKQTGPFSSAFTMQFQSTSLVIELEDGTIYQVNDMIDEVLDFWNYYFKNDLQIPNERLSIKLEDLFDN